MYACLPLPLHELLLHDAQEDMQEVRLVADDVPLTDGLLFRDHYLVLILVAQCRLFYLLLLDFLLVRPLGSVKSLSAFRDV